MEALDGHQSRAVIYSVSSALLAWGSYRYGTVWLAAGYLGLSERDYGRAQPHKPGVDMLIESSEKDLSQEDSP